MRPFRPEHVPLHIRHEAELTAYARQLRGQLKTPLRLSADPLPLPPRHSYRLLVLAEEGLAPWPSNLINPLDKEHWTIDCRSWRCLQPLSFRRNGRSTPAGTLNSTNCTAVHVPGHEAIAAGAVAADRMGRKSVYSLISRIGNTMSALAPRTASSGPMPGATRPARL